MSDCDCVCVCVYVCLSTVGIEASNRCEEGGWKVAYGCVGWKRKR